MSGTLSHTRRDQSTGEQRFSLRARRAGRSSSVSSSVSLCFCPRAFRNWLPRTSLEPAAFANIGIPYPELMGPFVGAVEIVCGTLIILGLLTRLAAIPLIIIMIVAIVSTKVPILLGHDFWIFHLPKLPRYGFWSMMHEARADFGMLLGALYLLIEGAGAWSLDAMLAAMSRTFNLLED